jgi:hypothetical protein
MRRASGEPSLRVDGANASGWVRVDRTSRGMGLAPAPAPDGVRVAGDRPVWHPVFGAPIAVHEAVMVAGGGLVLIAAPGVARSLKAPGLSQAFDRRPPGLMRVAGASRSNAGLLFSDDGWRAVVLPSLGDILPDLGPGPVALRADGRVVAFSRDGEVLEAALPDGTVAARHAGEVGALTYRADGSLIVGRGAAVGPPDIDASDGSPVVALAAAAEAPTVLARHADGTCSLWTGDSDGSTATWTPPVQGPASISLSPDGTMAAIGTPFAEPAVACVVDAVTGEVLLGVEQGRGIAIGPGGCVAVGGEWGVLWLDTVTEEENA